MVFPRLLALAERAWHRAPWEGTDPQIRQDQLKADWARFSKQIGAGDLAMLDSLGVEFRVPPPGAR